MTDSDWVKVAEYAATHEAELAAGRLESSGIPSRINLQDTVGLFGPSHAGISIRGVALEVPRSKLHEARAALDLEDVF